VKPAYVRSNVNSTTKPLSGRIPSLTFAILTLTLTLTLTLALKIGNADEDYIEVEQDQRTGRVLPGGRGAGVNGGVLTAAVRERVVLIRYQQLLFSRGPMVCGRTRVHQGDESEGVCKLYGAYGMCLIGGCTTMAVNKSQCCFKHGAGWHLPTYRFWEVDIDNQLPFTTGSVPNISSFHNSLTSSTTL
jgi:hypothetical protein